MKGQNKNLKNQPTLKAEFDRTIQKLRQQKLKGGNLDIDLSDIDITQSLYSEFKTEKQKRASNKRYSEQYTKNVHEQIEREKLSINRLESCQINDTINVDWVNSRLGNVNMELFSQMLTGDFFDDETMNTMVCLSKAAYLAKSSSLAPNDRIRSWIRNLRQIGAYSIAGYALLGNAGSGLDKESTATGAFIVKAIKDTSRSGELIHEVFVAMKGLNRIRKMCPNFAYVFGYVECSAPVGGSVTAKYPKNKQINTFCNTKGEGNDIVMAIYENVTPAKDFGTMIREGMNGEDFMRYYTALMMAEHVAMVECDFTHYDEHQENVLMRECTDSRYQESVANGGETLFYVPYTLKLSNGNVVTYYAVSPGRIPTIIDYGRSHVNVDGRNYGMPGDDSYLYIQQNVYRDRSNPLFDAFKLLGMCLAEAYDAGNTILVGQIAPLLRHFQMSEFKLTGISDFRRLSKNYMLPIESTLEDLEKFIGLCIDYSYAMGWYSVVDSPPEGSFVLTPVSDRLQIEVLRDIGLDEKLLPVPQPHTFLELYDVLSKQALLIEGYKGSIIPKSEFAPGTSEQTNKYWNDKIKETTAVFKEVRDQFVLPDKDGYTQLDIAYDFALRRMKEVTSDFFDANDSKINVNDQINSLEDINELIKDAVTIVKTPKRIDDYFFPSALKMCREYVAKIAAFAEMRDTLSTLDKALEYIAKIYSVSKKNRNEEAMEKLDNIHNYLHDFLANLMPISQEYYNSLGNFLLVFNESNNGERFNYWKNKTESDDDFEDFGWYFNIVMTIPSLFRS